MPFEELIRQYHMSDTELMMFTSNLVQSMTRDAASFASRGIDLAAITALETLGNSFEVFPDDEEYQADVSIAVETKNATREQMNIDIRKISDRASIKWGADSPQYKKFGVKGLGNMPDLKMLYTARKVVRVGTEYLADLTPEGLTQAMLDALDAEAQTFEDNLNTIDEKVELRDTKTQERIELGNELYSFVTKYCEIGKAIWKYDDEAKYNDYVIYPGTPELPGKVLNLAYDIPTFMLSWSAAPKAEDYQAEDKNSEPGFDWSVCYEGTELSCLHNPGSGSWNYRCRGHNEVGYGDWSDEILVLIPV